MSLTNDQSMNEKVNILEIEEISKAFGGVQALNKVSFNVIEHEIKAVIGPNGAGKTTLFNVIAKVFPATSGRVRFNGRDITNLASHDIARMGVGRTFQNVRVFNDLTAMANVMTGCYRVTKTGFIESALLLPKARKEERRTKEISIECLKVVGLERDVNRLAGDLPYGTRKLLELARTLASDPQLLLLDEPATGLNDSERGKMAELLYKLREMGKTIIIVEHQMNFVMGVSHHVIVLNYGKRIADGTPTEIQNNPEVVTAYLGIETDA